MKRGYFVLLLLSMILALGCNSQMLQGLSAASPQDRIGSPMTPTPTLGSTAMAMTGTEISSSPADGALGEKAQTVVSVTESPPASAAGALAELSPPENAAPAVSPQDTAVVTPTVTLDEPEASPPADAVAKVNGEFVWKKDYDRQFQLAKNALEMQGQDLSTEEGKRILATVRQQVLEDMINLTLIGQVAASQGVTITQKTVDAKAEETIEQGGGRKGFEQWLKETGQTEEDYKRMIHAQLITEAIGGKVAGKLPEKAPQVRARHILFSSREDAEKVLKELKEGKDFVALAKEHSIDQTTKDEGGDLGWFPRNMMPPEIDKVAFSLNPGEISDIVEDSFGTYHILQVVERDEERELTQEQINALNAAAFTRWLAEQRQAAEIERYIEFEN